MPGPAVLRLAEGHLVVDVEPPALADIVDEGAAVRGEALDAFGERARAAFVEAAAKRVDEGGRAEEDAGVDRVILVDRLADAADPPLLVDEQLGRIVDVEQRIGRVVIGRRG